MPASVTVRTGKEVVVAECDITPPEGKRFVCWSTEPDGKGMRYKPGKRIKLVGDMTLHPVWEDVPKDEIPEQDAAEGAVE